MYYLDIMRTVKEKSHQLLGFLVHVRLDEFARVQISNTLFDFVYRL
jgi:hypothetical protein